MINNYVIGFMLAGGICLTMLIILHILKVIYYIKSTKEQEKRIKLFKKK